MTDRVTILDVAKAVGVSAPVVSTVLNQRRSTVRVSAATRKKIIETAQRLNYKPSVIARSFRSGRSFLIGLAHLYVNTPYLAQWIRALRGCLDDRGLSLIVDTHHDFASQQAAIDRLIDRRVEGVIATSVVIRNGRTDPQPFERLRQAGIPVVEIMGMVIPDVPRVNVDYVQVGRQQTRHLLDLGHREVVLLTHARYARGRRHVGWHWDALQQSEGYVAEMREAGLEPLVITHEVPPETGDEEMMQSWLKAGRTSALGILNHSRRPTAVICHSGVVASGLIQACRDADMDVPQRLSVVGGGDERWAAMIQPPLTSILFPTERLITEAASLLWNLMDGKQPSSVQVASELVVRQSTAAPLW
ncbi:MAG: LacI family DNA-binding transcriptional regulator [Phycisphaeraceae bacterium]|nr:LacI family DNA-binding transcriptional regulator [Phycisphaeraceae bacterium]